MSSPVTGSFDADAFFASPWLVWGGWMTRAMAKELKESKFMERSTCVGGLLDVDL